jgi:hypothetical protein
MDLVVFGCDAVWTRRQTGVWEKDAVIFRAEDGNSLFLRNVGRPLYLRVHTASLHRRTA